MRFSSILAVFALPMMVLAGPSPMVAREADPLMDAAINQVMKRGPMSQASAEMEMAAMIASRQLDLSSLTGLLANLSASFSAIEQLLAPATLNNIKEVVDDLATLLESPTTTQLKSLVNTISTIIGSDSVSSLLDSLPTLLSSVSGLLTPALISNVTDILGGAHDLLTPSFVSETKGLIADVAPVSVSPLYFLSTANSFQLVSAISQVISALLAAVFGTS
jgi:hypothetical protein